MIIHDSISLIKLYLYEFDFGDCIFIARWAATDLVMVKCRPYITFNAVRPVPHTELRTINSDRNLWLLFKIKPSSTSWW